MKYLKVWTNFREVLSKLKDDEIGRLFVMMLVYAETGEEPTDFVGNETFVFPMAKQMIDLANEKAKKLQENGSKGGIAKSNNKQKIASDSKSYQDEANDSNEKQDVAEKKRKEKKRNEKETPTEYRRFTPPTVEEVAAYCKQRGNSVNAERFCAFYASKGWKVGNQQMKDWKAAVITWEQRDAPAKKVAAQDFPQRDYSEVQSEMMSDLEKEMAAFKKEVG